MGSQKNPKQSADKIRGRDLQDQAYAMKLRELSYAEIAEKQSCGRTTAHRRVKKAAARIAKENSGNIRRIAAQEDQRTREGIRKVLLLEDRSETLTVECTCGADVEFSVPALSPSEVQTGRKVVLDHSKEIRRIHGSDATEKSVVRVEVADSLAEIMEGFKKYHPEIIEAVKDTLNKMAEAKGG